MSSFRILDEIAEAANLVGGNRRGLRPSRNFIILILIAGAYASKFGSTPMQALISVLNLTYLSLSAASGPERADTITLGAGGGVVI